MKTCRHKNHSEIVDILLLASDKINLFSINTTNATLNEIGAIMVYSGKVSPKSIDYSFRGNYMSFTDDKQLTISPIISTDPSVIKEVIIFKPLGNPSIISIDWIHDLVY